MNMKTLKIYNYLLIYLIFLNLINIIYLFNSYYKFFFSNSRIKNKYKNIQFFINIIDNVKKNNNFFFLHKILSLLLILKIN